MEPEFALVEGALHQALPAKSAIKDILYGSTAGIVSKLIEHPLDLVKVRLQSQPIDQPLKFKGPLDCMVQTFKGEGVKGLWRGVSMPIGGAMAENATLFVVYNQTQALLRRLYPPPPTLATEAPPLVLSHLVLSAALAGACASFVLTPVELVKCKMQVQNLVTPSATSSVRAPGPVAITRSIIMRDGIKGLWLGQTGTLIRETGGSGAWFTTFELLSAFFIQRRALAGETGAGGGRVTKGDLSAVELMSAGAAAGVTYNCLLFPADCIKSTIQTEDELRGLGKGGAEEGGARRTFVQVGKDIYKARGIRGLYSGCGLTALRAAPSSAFIFYIYSRLEAYFG